MIIISISFFAFAAMLGLYLITYILKGKNTPKGLVFIHGALALTGFLFLLAYSFFSNNEVPYLPITLFVITLFGGFFMVLRDIMFKSVPKWMAIGHGVMALISIGSLVRLYLTIQASV